jgi:L-iditol 2-dehydrogenase
MRPFGNGTGSAVRLFDLERTKLARPALSHRIRMVAIIQSRSSSGGDILLPSPRSTFLTDSSNPCMTCAARGELITLSPKLIASVAEQQRRSFASFDLCTAEIPGSLAATSSSPVRHSLLSRDCTHSRRSIDQRAEKMKAAFLSGIGSVEIKDVPTPTIGEGEILVQMRCCGVCGTDVEKFHGSHITPPILGHEVAGEIEAIGGNIQPHKRGDRVIVHHHVSCKSCFYCKNGFETMCEAYPESNLDPGGFAEYFRVPEALVKGGTVYKLPKSMTFEMGSLVEPTACCIRALRRSGIRAGDSVAVFGAGPVGLTHVQLLKLYGTAPIFAIDILEPRRQMASKFGADLTLDPTTEDVAEKTLANTSGRGADYAIVATGNPEAIQQAAASVRKGGRVILFGAPGRGTLVSLDMSRLFLREIAIQSSYSTSETEMQMALDLLQTQRIDPSPMITHRLPLEEVIEALHLAEKGGEAVKVIVENR